MDLIDNAFDGCKLEEPFGNVFCPLPGFWFILINIIIKILVCLVIPPVLDLFTEEFMKGQLPPILISMAILLEEDTQISRPLDYELLDYIPHDRSHTVAPSTSVPDTEMVEVDTSIHGTPRPLFSTTSSGAASSRGSSSVPSLSSLATSAREDASKQAELSTERFVESFKRRTASQRTQYHRFQQELLKQDELKTHPTIRAFRGPMMKRLKNDPFSLLEQSRKSIRSSIREVAQQILIQHGLAINQTHPHAAPSPEQIIHRHAVKMGRIKPDAPLPIIPPSEYQLDTFHQQGFINTTSDNGNVVQTRVISFRGGPGAGACPMSDDGTGAFHIHTQMQNCTDTYGNIGHHYCIWKADGNIIGPCVIERCLCTHHTPINAHCPITPCTSISNMTQVNIYIDGVSDTQHNTAASFLSTHVESTGHPSHSLSTGGGSKKKMGKGGGANEGPPSIPPVPLPNPPVVMLLKKALFSALVHPITATVAESTTRSISSRVVPPLFDNFIDEMQDTVRDSIPHALTHILASSLPLTLGTTVPDLTDRLLPIYPIRSLTESMTMTMTRAIGHTVTSTLLHTLGHSPLREHYCFYCLYYKWQCMECHHHTHSDIHYAQYYGYFLSSYFSDYYADFYAQEVYEVMKK